MTSPGGLSTLFNSTTCSRKGLCPVTRIRNQVETFESHSLYYEIHGNGPEKLVFIMGLNSSCFAWLAQVQHFGPLPNYSMLVFDNRGVGHSGSPRGPYTAFDYLKWTEKRNCMRVPFIWIDSWLSPELATRIPDRIASLTLAVTTPGGAPWTNFPPWKGTISLARDGISIRWLDEPAEGDVEGRTNREIQVERLFGALSQMYAALTHHVTSERLRSISEAIPKVLILTGDDDNLISPANSRYIKSCMPDAELEEWEGTGHALHSQRPRRFNQLLERVFKEGRRKANTQ
ncbi:alpha/beta-hydrolase [Mycena leptocephala]|nr:alpha/beta-hydrolase [Mycena leptocephala]